LVIWTNFKILTILYRLTISTIFTTFPVWIIFYYDQKELTAISKLVLVQGITDGCFLEAKTCFQKGYLKKQ
jgi:ABC-type multidrug transport system permease subunit